MRVRLRGSAVLVFLIGMQAYAADDAPVKLDASTPKEVQTRLAKEAAPPEVSDKATIMVLGANGYSVLSKGTNGFTCVVFHERPESLEPTCYDAEASRTLLKADLFADELRRKGIGEEEIRRRVDAAFKSGGLKVPRRAGLIYMLSPHNRIFDPSEDKVVPMHGHLMFYSPYATTETVGSGNGAPFVVNPGRANALMIVVPK